MRTTTKSFPLNVPQAGKCNIIEEILLGGTNQLNKKNGDHNPRNMIGKLEAFIGNTSDEDTKLQAETAIEFLEMLKRDIPANEADRKRIFGHVSNLKKTEI